MQNKIPLEQRRCIFPLLLQQVVQSNIPHWIDCVSPAFKHVDLTDCKGCTRHNPIVYIITVKGIKRVIKLSTLLGYIFKGVDKRIRHDVIHSYVLLYKEVNRTLEKTPQDKNLIVYLETKLRLYANVKYTRGIIDDKLILTADSRFIGKRIQRTQQCAQLGVTYE